MILIYTLLIVLMLNLLGFLIAFLFKSDKLTDFLYGFSFIVIALYSYLEKGFTSLSSILLLSLITLWGLRLAGHLVFRIIKTKKDKRFDGIRESFWRFGSFWLLQAVTAWIVMIPSVYFFQNPLSLSWLSIIGLILWIIGFFFESIADYQKLTFINNPKNTDRFIDSGLWSISRHPNYFGEILMWCGIYLYVFPALSSTARLFSLASPILIIMLLIFVSGIPKLEKYADEKWGKNRDYQEYKKRVPVLVPKIKK